MNYTCNNCGQLLQLQGSTIPDGSTCPQCTILLEKEYIKLFTVVCPASNCRTQSNRRIVGEPCPYCSKPMVEYTPEEKIKDDNIRRAAFIQSRHPANLSILFYFLAFVEVISGIILAVNVAKIYLLWGFSGGIATMAIGSLVSHLNYIAQERTDRLIKEERKDNSAQ